MVKYIREMKMAGRYQFSEEEIKAIEQKRKENKDKRVEARLKALELRSKGAKAHEAAATGFHDTNGLSRMDRYFVVFGFHSSSLSQFCSLFPDLFSLN